jgi:hypothetical protein
METLVITLTLIALLFSLIVPAILVVRRVLERDDAMLESLGELQRAARAAPGGRQVAVHQGDPVGTFALLSLYLMVIIGLWGAMFVLLIGRE